MSDFKAEIHQIRCRPDPAWGALQRSSRFLAWFKATYF